MNLREEIEQYIDSLTEDTLVSLSEFVNNERVAADLQTILDRHS